MAIHEQNYVSYDGPLREGHGWWVFARTTIGLAKSLKRTWILTILLWIPVLITLGLVFFEYGMRDQLPGELMGSASAPGATGVIYFLQVQFYSAALLMMASGCGTISEDLRYRTFQLYFSRPVERWEYVFGKFLGLFLICSVVTVIPALLIGGLRAAYFARTDLAGAVIGQTATALALSVSMTVVISSVVLGLSSLTRKTGYAVLGWIGVVIVPLIITFIVSIASSGAETAQLWNLPGNFLLVSEHLIAEEAPEVAVFWPLLILSTVTGAALYTLRHRINKLEGIA
ncbi:MAG: ABC transporter permease [Persicimonas sp.]